MEWVWVLESLRFKFKSSWLCISAVSMNKLHPGIGTSPGGPVAKTLLSNAGDMCLTLGQ